ELAGALPELEDAALAVERQRGRTGERGELAGGAAAAEVHLEEALLRMQEALRTVGVRERRGVNSRDRRRVELDDDGCGKARHGGRAVSPRQRGGQRDRARGGRGDGRNGCGHEDSLPSHPRPSL